MFEKSEIISGLATGILVIVVLANTCKPVDEECTLALISGSATSDGRALLWKNRECPATFQEYVYCDSGQFAFIGVTNAGVTDQVWGGINEAGFAVGDANAYNFANLYPGPDDDGYIMYLALGTCQTVEDFEAMMDSTEDEGRHRTAIYGVIDANGDGAFFEAATYEHYRYDLGGDSIYMVRATFAYSGAPGPYASQHRHDRARDLLDSAFHAGCLSRQFITQSVMRDLVGVTTNPYPLPFQGQEGSLPYGFINTNSEALINRCTTRAGLVVQGILPTEDPLLTTLWAMVAEPISTLALPLWVHAGSVPAEFSGPEFDQSPLNLQAQLFRDYLYPDVGGGTALDTWRLVDQWGEGLLPFLFSRENQAFAAGDSALNVWRNQGVPNPGVVEGLQNSLAAWALAEMSVWGPPEPPVVDVSLISEDLMQLDWAPVTTNVFGNPITVSGYTVYASDQLFWNRLAGDSLTTVPTPPVTISIPDTHRFFQVRCQP